VYPPHTGSRDRTHTTKNTTKTLLNCLSYVAFVAPPRDIRGNIIFRRVSFAAVFLTCPPCRLPQVEVKPYVLDDQLCDECQGTRCGGKFAPFFCANVTCLQYYCEYCWAAIHSRAGREFHKPLVKEGGDRPRHISFRWNWGERGGGAGWGGGGDWQKGGGG